MSASRKPRPRCTACGGGRLFGPGPMRTSAHPNSSALLVEAPGSRFHDFNVQGVVCLDCGHVALSLSAATLASLRAAAEEAPAETAAAEPPRRRRGGKPRR